MVGTLVILDDGKNWFVGHKMDQDTAIKFAPMSNATAWYVSAGVLSAIDWIKQNESCGVLFPEFADHTHIVQNFLKCWNLL